jgi:hypothetical protein
VIIWILSFGRRPYIAAVFDDRAAAEHFLADLPAPIRDQSSVGWRDDLALPCYLAEDENGIRPLSAAEAQGYVTGLDDMVPDAHGVYGNLYRLEATFLPALVGRDEMGRIPHVHLEARHITAVAQGGIRALW